MTNRKDKQRQKNTEDFISASNNGDIETVKQLLPLITNMAVKNNVLAWAAEYGHIEIVKLLIPVCEPTANYSHALRMASSSGNVEIFKLLFPLTLSTNNVDFELKLALQYAAVHQHTDIIEHMLPHIDYNTVFRSLLSNSLDATALQQCIEKYEALQQKEQLTQSLQTTVQSLPSHKRKL